MKQKAAGLAAVAAMALMAFATDSASATTLEVSRAAQNNSVSIAASIIPGTGVGWWRTDGSAANWCSASSIGGSTVSPFSGTTVKVSISTMSFTSCERAVTVHKGGSLHIAYKGGTDGTVSSSGAEITIGSPFGTLNCKTGEGTNLGTLWGAGGGLYTTHAELHIEAVVNCGFLVPSALWSGTYVVTSPTGLGVIA